jgi:hypothetical protein
MRVTILAVAAGLLAAALVALLVSAVDAATAMVALAAMSAGLATRAVLARRADNAGCEGEAEPIALRQQAAEEPVVGSKPEQAPAPLASALVAARIDELAPFFTLTDAQLRSVASQTGEAAIGILEQLRNLDVQRKRRFGLIGFQLDARQFL